MEMLRNALCSNLVGLGALANEVYATRHNLPSWQDQVSERTFKEMDTCSRFVFINNVACKSATFVTLHDRETLTAAQ